MNAIIISALMGVLMMFSGIIFKNKIVVKNIAIAALFVLLVAHLAGAYAIATIHMNLNNMLVFERLGTFFTTISIVTTLLFVILSGDEIIKVGVNGAEYFALIFFVLTGIAILSSFNNLLMLFLGIEIMTIPLFILTGADKRNLKSNEASLKYFLMGAFSTGILLMGIALFYGASGSFNIEVVKNSIAGQPTAFGILIPLGLLLMFIALAFKVSAAPFHFWTPDVYDGAPTVFTAFMATVVKAAGFIAFVRLFEVHYTDMGVSWKIIIPVIIIATLLVGNITAVFQQSVKRMLAYSSIAQAGFMLFALYGFNDLSKEGLLLYTVSYSLATIGIFAILIKMNDYTFEGFNGLAKTQPVLAFANTVFLLSLAGIPLTAGFFAKYYMLASAIKESSSNLWLVVVALLFATVSVYYYFKVIQAMYFKEGEATTATIHPLFKYLLLLLVVLIIIIGVYPSALLQWFYF
jgi:NADH-quinone oxidoreductase subunit N